MAAEKKRERSYQIHVVGARRAFFGDWYHAFLRMPWSAVLAIMASAYLALNSLFALLYFRVGGVAHARPGSFVDAFDFSVQTMGTIGYGVMYPESDAANALVLAESIISLMVTAVMTGLIFAKFARPVGKIAFSRYAVISPMDGVPTLQFRVGNERGNMIVEATVKVTMVRTVKTAEGQTFYRQVDLRLQRERSAAVQRSWTILHAIDEASPLRGMNPDTCKMEDIELMVSIAGTDDTSYQPTFGRHTYEQPDILWGARYADVLSEMPNGDLILDVRRFHDVLPSEPTEAFPYSIGSSIKT